MDALDRLLQSTDCQKCPITVCRNSYNHPSMCYCKENLEKLFWSITCRSVLCLETLFASECLPSSGFAFIFIVTSIAMLHVLLNYFFLLGNYVSQEEKVGLYPRNLKCFLPFWFSISLALWKLLAAIHVYIFVLTIFAKLSTNSFHDMNAIDSVLRPRAR